MADFAASNCGLTAIAILFVLGETNAILPMALGCLFGTAASIFVVGQLYDSSIFPAEESWAPGIATAEVLEAGDEGGSKAKRIIEGIVVGMVGSHFKSCSCYRYYFYYQSGIHYCSWRRSDHQRLQRSGDRI